MASTSGIEFDPPLIPRYWWLKRITVLAGSVLVFLVIIRLAWGWDANRRLQAALAEIRARGEPIDPEDFVMPHVPDERNYVHYLKQAVVALDQKVESPAQGDWDYNNYPPYEPSWYQRVRTAMGANLQALQLARTAREHIELDWDIDFTSPIGLQSPAVPFDDAQALANLLSDAALHEHLRGNDSEAMELVMDILAIGGGYHRHPQITSHYVAEGIDQRAAKTALTIAPAIRVAGGTAGGPNDASVRPASISQVRAVIALFMDSDRSNGFRRGMQWQRMTLPDFYNWHATHRSFLLRPMLRLDAVELIDHANRIVQVSDRSQFRQMRTQFPGTSLSWPTRGEPIEVRAIPRALSSNNRVTSYPLARNLEYLAENRMAAISLAMALYRAEHASTWPPGIASLVPEYLPRIPLDPFSPVDEPIKYIHPSQGGRPMVYSIGQDGRDDTRAGAKIPTEPQYMSQYSVRRPNTDLWFDLSRFSPAR